MMADTDINNSKERELRPPPYSPNVHQENVNPEMSYQVRNGEVAVVYPPASYDNMGFAGEAPGYGVPESYGSKIAPAVPMEHTDLGFSDPEVRRGFIKKIYLTLLVQQIGAIAFMCLVYFWSEISWWIKHNDIFTYCMFGVPVVVLLIFSFCGKMCRTFPFNYCALVFISFVKGALLGSVALTFNSEPVLWGVGATAIITLGMCLLSCQSKVQLTIKTSNLLVLILSVLPPIILLIVVQSQYLPILYVFLASLVISLYLVSDTMIIVDRKHRRYDITQLEHVFAALTLYVDLTRFPLFLTALINLCRGK